MKKLIIIPTYNEIANISPMIDKVFSLPEPFDLLIIDDGSPDGVVMLWLQPSSAVILEPKKIKSLTVSIVSPSICHGVMGQDAMILVF